MNYHTASTFNDGPRGMPFTVAPERGLPAWIAALFRRWHARTSLGTSAMPPALLEQIRERHPQTTGVFTQPAFEDTLVQENVAGVDQLSEPTLEKASEPLAATAPLEDGAVLPPRLASLEEPAQSCKSPRAPAARLLAQVHADLRDVEVTEVSEADFQEAFREWHGVPCG